MKTQIKDSLKKLFLIAFLLVITCSVYGQAAGNKKEIREQKREQIQAQKVAFISQELQLTPEVAQKFWPLYNAYTAKKEEFAKTKRETEKSARQAGLDKLSDKQAEDLINAQLLYEQQMLDLKKQYKEIIKPVIGVQNVLKLYQSEKKFNSYLLKQLKHAGNRAPDNE